MTTIRERHPHRIPIVLIEGTRGINLTNHKYLVPKEHTMADFIQSVRKHCKLNPSEALFFMINKTLVPTNITIGALDQEFESSGEMLQITVMKENTFGN